MSQDDQKVKGDEVIDEAALPRLEPIERFAGEFWFLSNFWPATVEWEGERYVTVEHAFQAAKTDDPDERLRIRLAVAPGAAKRIGRQVALRSGWEGERVRVMRALVLQKFTLHPELGERLLQTRGRELVEGNDWGDRFWGVCGGEGQNRLGHILMEVRAHLAGRRDARGEGARGTRPKGDGPPAPHRPRPERRQA